MQKSNPSTHPFSSSTYSQLGTINDSSLNLLREQIKKVMIPMLIKIFQLKLELSQSISLPSRLQPKAKESPEKILSQLKDLDEDLKLLSLWCSSSRTQIEKALALPEEELKTSAKTTITTPPHPSISKSFSSAVFAQSIHLSSKTLSNLHHSNPSHPIKTKQSWWSLFMKPFA